VFDGFFTLLVATEDENAVVRDSFACKPMVIADTTDCVGLPVCWCSTLAMPGAPCPLPAAAMNWRKSDATSSNAGWRNSSASDS
jgi:hypothetical protein